MPSVTPVSGQTPLEQMNQMRLVFAPAVDRLIGYMRERKLQLCPFLVRADGRHGEDACLTIALHAELFEKRGYQVVSHSVYFEDGPSAQDPEKIVTKTCCSLMVRSPRVLS